MPRPSARSSVPESSRRTLAHSSSGRMARDQALAWSSPALTASAAAAGSVSASAGRWCTSSTTSSVRWRRDSRRCRSGAAVMPLIGRDVAGQAPARVGRVVRGAERERMPQGRSLRQAGSAKASSACSRRLSRGTTQQTRSTIPAATSRAAAITGKSDFPPPGVTAARRCGRVPHRGVAAVGKSPAERPARVWRRRATYPRRWSPQRRWVGLGCGPQL